MSEKKKSEMQTKTINLTIKDALEMLECFRSIARIKLNVFIKFDIGHNINRLKLIEDKINLVKSNDDIESFEEYQNGIKDLIMKHGKAGVIKKDDTNAIAAYEHDMELHKKEFANVVEALNQKEKDLKELLKKEEELEDMIVLPLDRFPIELEEDITPIMSLIER